MLLHYETDADAHAAATQLRALGPHARRLLEMCVETQGLKRKKISAAAELLSACGFIFIRDSSDMWKAEVTLRPSLAGEEALEALESNGKHS